MQDYIAKGYVIEPVLAYDVSSGDTVVMGRLLGVAKRDAPAGTENSILTQGVIGRPKVSGRTVTHGDELCFKVATKNFDLAANAAAGDIVGGVYAWADSDAADESVQVKFTGTLGAIQA